MNLQISGRRLDITPAIHDYVTEKIGRTIRHFDNLIDANIVLSVNKLEQKAEVTVHLAGKDVFVEATAESMYAAIDVAVDKLDRQMQKHKEKQQDYRREQRNNQKRVE